MTGRKIRSIGFYTLVGETRTAERLSQRKKNSNSTNAARQIRLRLARAKRVAVLDDFIIQTSKSVTGVSSAYNLWRKCIDARNALPKEQQKGLGSDPLFIRIRILRKQGLIRDVRKYKPKKKLEVS